MEISLKKKFNSLWMEISKKKLKLKVNKKVKAIFLKCKIYIYIYCSFNFENAICLYAYIFLSCFEHSKNAISILQWNKIMI